MRGKIMVAPASQYDKAIDKAREIAAEVAEFAQSINEELRRHQESAVDFHMIPAKCDFT